jgi:hypothetical protein
MSDPNLNLVKDRPYRCEAQQAQMHGCADPSGGCRVLERRRLVRRLLETLRALAGDASSDEPLDAPLVEYMAWKAIRVLEAVEESVGQPQESGQ